MDGYCIASGGEFHPLRSLKVLGGPFGGLVHKLVHACLKKEGVGSRQRVREYDKLFGGRDLVVVLTSSCFSSLADNELEFLFEQTGDVCV